MKLHKVNKNGSLSVILPKRTLQELNWTAEDFVIISGQTVNSILISNEKIIDSNSNNYCLQLLIQDLNNIISELKVLSKNVLIDEQKELKQITKKVLLQLVEKL